MLPRPWATITLPPRPTARLHRYSTARSHSDSGSTPSSPCLTYEALLPLCAHGNASFRLQGPDQRSWGPKAINPRSTSPPLGLGSADRASLPYRRALVAPPGGGSG
jgi:hypothetical protein